MGNSSSLSTTAVGGGGMTRRDFDMDDALDAAEPLLEKLTRFWMDERNAPEILEWQGLVVDEVLNKLHAQVHAHTLSPVGLLDL